MKYEFIYLRMNVSIQCELASGTLRQAKAAALITKSLIDIFMLSLASCSLRSFLTLLIHNIRCNLKILRFRLQFFLLLCVVDFEIDGQIVVRDCLFGLLETFGRD